MFCLRRLTYRYNGHPDFAHMSEEFATALTSSDTVAVVGVGNVALDCARILAKGKERSRSVISSCSFASCPGPALYQFNSSAGTFCFRTAQTHSLSTCGSRMPIGAGALRNTDICDHALDVLSSAGAGLRRVVILGRRGHVQASFTMKVSPRPWDLTTGLSKIITS